MTEIRGFTESKDIELQQANAYIRVVTSYLLTITIVAPRLAKSSKDFRHVLLTLL